MTSASQAIQVYQFAKTAVLGRDQLREVRWQRTREPANVTESEFLREAAWVILCSGFRERVVQAKFGYISLCFFDFESARDICANADECIGLASHAFANRKKLKALADIASLIAKSGFHDFWAALRANPIEHLQRLPFIGPVTCYHLAKNLGFQYAKPDRHLVKLAAIFGFACPNLLCDEIATRLGEDVRVVDLILWRASEVSGSAVEFVRRYVSNAAFNAPDAFASLVGAANASS